MHGLDAADWWDAILPRKFERNGTLVVAPARDQSELQRFASRTSGYEWLDEEDIASLEPALAGRFGKACSSPREAHLDPRRALTLLREKLTAQGRVVHRRERGRARLRPTCVDCTGAAQIGKDRRSARRSRRNALSRDR